MMNLSQSYINTTQFGRTFFQRNESSFTNNNISCLLDENPELITGGNLYSEFLSEVQQHSLNHQVLDLMRGFYNRLSTALELLVTIDKTTHNTISDLDISLKNFITHERHTWTLILSLYKDRFDNELRADSSQSVDVPDVNYSEKELINLIYEKDTELREAQLVTDWLEGISRENLENNCQSEAQFVSELILWENTHHCLKYQSGDYCRKRNLITSLYPDAPIEGKAILLNDDKEEEERFLRYLFILIRAGQLDVAQQLCISTGQAWRAAELEGWRLYHDQGLRRSGVTEQAMMEGEDERDIEGNPNRILFKSVNWRTSNNERLSLTERCIFSIYAGNLDVLLHMCKSYDDILWAHLKVMIESRVDAKVRTLTDRGVLDSQCIMGPLSDDGSPDLPDSAWIPGEWEVSEVFHRVESLCRGGVSRSRSHVIIKDQDESETLTQMFRRIQKHFVLRDIDAVVRDVHDIVQNLNAHNNRLFKHTLRFVAHIVLFIERVHADLNHSACTAILESYVKVLIDNDDCDLIAFYVAQLDQSIQNNWYAKYLQDVQGREKRVHTVNLGQSAGLNMARIVSLVVTSIRKMTDSVAKDTTSPSWNPGSAVFDNDDIEPALMMRHNALTPLDLRKIDAIDWLIIVPNQLPEALRQCNALCRHFIIYDKVQGAKEAIQKLPAETLDKVARDLKRQDNQKCSHHVPNWLLNAQREHECILLFLEARDAFNDWYNHFTRNRPHMPAMMEPQSAGLSLRETICRENRIKEYEAELNKWKHVLELHCNSVCAKIFCVLESSYPGFLIDEYSWVNVDTSLLSEQDASIYQEEASRQKELLLLRQYCLRDLTFLLVRVLKSVGRHQEVLRISDVIASEEYKHYQVFQAHQMQQLLHHFREASLALLDLNLDTLGYSAT